MKKIVLFLTITLAIISCETEQMNTPCDCINMQIDMLEGKGSQYGETFGLCNELTQGKSESEIEKLQEEYENCSGYDRLKEKYIPFVQDIVDDSDIIEKFDNETVKDALQNLDK